MSAPSTRIGSFVLEARIAQAPGCTLWRASRAEGRAHDPTSVVVRLLDDPSSCDGLPHLQREYRRLGALGGNGAPEAVALFAGHGALVRTWHEGETLRRALEARDGGWLEFGEATALEVALGVARALRAAHRASDPIVHGRIAPSEILLGRDGGVTLLGWGGWTPSSWAEGQAPEVIGGQAPGVAADLWSLGALLLLLLEPHAPPGRTPSAALAALGRRWPAMGRLCEDLLVPDPAARPPSVEAVLPQFLALSRAHGGVASIGETVVRAAQPRTRVPVPLDLVGPTPPLLGPPPRARTPEPPSPPVAAPPAVEAAPEPPEPPAEPARPEPPCMPAETPSVAPSDDPPVPVADLPPVPPPRGETPSRMGTPERVALVLAALVSAGILATLVRACLAS